MAYITLDKGPMFSGKTLSLINRLTKYPSSVRKGVFKHAFDSRFSTDEIVTHSGIRVKCIPIESLDQIDVDQYDVIAIDEAQFFDGLDHFLRSNFRKDVIIHLAGLNGDRDQMNFGDINIISPLCSEEILHHSICSVCMQPSSFSVALKKSEEVVDVGGDDKYETRCHRCV